MYRVERLKTYLIKEILKHAVDEGYLPANELVNYAYSNTSHGSALRSLLVDWHLWHTIEYNNIQDWLVNMVKYGTGSRLEKGMVIAFGKLAQNSVDPNDCNFTTWRAREYVDHDFPDADDDDSDSERSSSNYSTRSESPSEDEDEDEERIIEDEEDGPDLDRMTKLEDGPWSEEDEGEKAEIQEETDEEVAERVVVKERYDYKMWGK